MTRILITASLLLFASLPTAAQPGRGPDGEPLRRRAQANRLERSGAVGKARCIQSTTPRGRQDCAIRRARNNAAAPATEYIQTRHAGLRLRQRDGCADGNCCRRQLRGRRGNARETDTRQSRGRGAARTATPGACRIGAAGQSASLSPAEADALRAALLDEYAAEAYYTAAIDAFGSVRMFENIRDAERRHAAALLTLFRRYGVEPPARSSAAPPNLPATLPEAIDAAIRVEQDNAEMYDELLVQVRHDDVAAVMQRLRDASLQRHLPALKRWR